MHPTDLGISFSAPRITRVPNPHAPRAARTTPHIASVRASEEIPIEQCRLSDRFNQAAIDGVRETSVQQSISCFEDLNDLPSPCRDRRRQPEIGCHEPVANFNPPAVFHRRAPVAFIGGPKVTMERRHWVGIL
jgi:hypothetical protein